ncbi:MAG: hypothetical protein WC518_01665 [Patescibacteria group bacterium]
MNYKIIIFILIILLVFIVQNAFLDNLSFFFFSFNLLLITLVLLVDLADFKLALWFSLVGGFLLDTYSSLPFGIFLLTLFLTAIVLKFLFFNFFTNRSLYSLIILGLVAVLVYQGGFLLLSSLFYLLGFSDFLAGWSFIWLISAQLVNMTIVLTVSFWLINKLSKFFKPIFLKS